MPSSTRSRTCRRRAPGAGGTRSDRRGVSRVTMIGRVGLALLLVTAEAAIAQPSAVKIGVLLPYTGVLSLQGQDVTRGIELHLSRVGGRAGGREIQLVREDTE